VLPVMRSERERRIDRERLCGCEELVG
jgi:hypothetical protein